MHITAAIDKCVCVCADNVPPLNRAACKPDWLLAVTEVRTLNLMLREDQIVMAKEK